MTLGLDISFLPFFTPWIIIWLSLLRVQLIPTDEIIMRKGEKEEGHISPARAIAFYVLEELLNKGSDEKADELLERLIRRFGADHRDASLAYEITYGCLRNLSFLDYQLESFMSRGMEHTPPSVRNILRIGAYQILRLNQIPDFAIVNESVELAKKHGERGMSALVNAVLRRFIREGPRRPLPARSKNPVRYLEIKYSFPRWLARLMRRRWGDEEAEQFLKASNQPAN